MGGEMFQCLDQCVSVNAGKEWMFLLLGWGFF